MTLDTNTPDLNESANKDEPMETSAAEISVEDSSDKAENNKDDSTAIDTSELDASKENSLSVSLFVHTDDIQDDLDDDLKEAAAKAAAAAEAAAKNQEKEQEKSVKGDRQTTVIFRICSSLFVELNFKSLST